MLQDIVQDMKMKDRHSKGDAREMTSSKHTVGILMEQLRVWLEYGWSMGRVWQGVSQSEVSGLIVRSKRTPSPKQADSQSGVSGLRVLRYVLVVLMMVVGVNEMWGQTDCYSAYKKGTVPLSTSYFTKSDMVQSANAVVTAGETKLPTPTIEILETPNGENKNIIFSISPTIAGVTYKYTLDGTDPSESNGTEASSILLESPAIVKVIATHPDYITSDVAFSTSYVIPTNVPVLLQQKECYAFFMTQAKEENGKLRLTTTNIPDDNIIWHFETTGETGTYYIVKGNNPTAEDRMFMCYGKDSKNTNVFYLGSPENSEKTKFVLNNHIVDGVSYFNFQIKGQNLYVNRSSGNANTNYVVTTGNRGQTYNSTLLRIHALPTNKADMISLVHPLSFNTSNTTNAYYYRLKNVNDATYYITAPANPATEYVKGGTDTSDNTTVWYLKEATDAAPITPYYYIVNAVTGLYMYFSGTAGSNNAVQIKEYDSSNADSYKFIVVQAAKGRELTPSGYFNFIPKALQNQVNQENNALGLQNTKTNSLKTSRSRDNTSAQWTFVTAPLFCNKPVFDEEAGNITMSCDTYSSVIHYTTDGTTPNASTPTIFTNETELSTNDTYLIKAIAVIRNNDQTASSEAITLFNKPNVTLLDEDSNPVDENTYTYDKTEHEPTVSKVAITIGETEYVAPTSPTVSYVIDSYENNINAGTATVNLVDNDNTDNIFFGNFSKDFTINKASLTITPDDNQSKEYGDPDPELTYTASGLLGSDELTGSLSRDEGETVEGTYAITQGTLGNSNYAISFTTGKTFTITKKSLGDNINTPAPNITCDITETGGTHSIVVKQCGNDLTLDTDYAKEGEDDGIKYYQVTVTGTGNYKDGFSVKLAKIQLSKLAGSSAPGGAALFVSNSDDYDFVVPDNMAAYIVTGISGNTLVTEQLDNIPSQEPVLLISTIDANGFLVKTTTGTAPTGTNLLKEVTDDPSKHFETAKIYLLYNGEFVLNMAGDLAKGKIYLPRPSGAPSRLFIVWEQPTAIDAPQLSTVNSQLSTDTWYTLDGRKLSGKPTQKGLYIVNGKKVMVE